MFDNSRFTSGDLEALEVLLAKLKEQTLLTEKPATEKAEEQTKEVNYAEPQKSLNFHEPAVSENSFQQGAATLGTPEGGLKIDNSTHEYPWHGMKDAETHKDRIGYGFKLDPKLHAKIQWIMANYGGYHSIQQFLEKAAKEHAKKILKNHGIE